MLGLEAEADILECLKAWITTGRKLLPLFNGNPSFRDPEVGTWIAVLLTRIRILTPNKPPPRTKSVDGLQPGNKDTLQETVDSYSDTWHLKQLVICLQRFYQNQVFTDRLMEAEISRNTGYFKTPSAY